MVRPCLGDNIIHTTHDNETQPRVGLEKRDGPCLSRMSLGSSSITTSRPLRNIEGQRAERGVRAAEVGGWVRWGLKRCWLLYC